MNDMKSKSHIFNLILWLFANIKPFLPNSLYMVSFSKFIALSYLAPSISQHASMLMYVRFLRFASVICIRNFTFKIFSRSIEDLATLETCKT